MKRNDTKSPSQLKKPESIGWKKEIRKTPIDPLEIIAKENEEWQKEQQKTLRRYKSLGVFEELIKSQERKANMTKIEWQNHCKKQDKLAKEDRQEYLRNNKMNKKIVNSILDLFKDKEYVKGKMPVPDCPCNTCFAIAFDPDNKFKMSWDDWDYGLYDDLIDGQLNQVYK